MNKPRMFYFGPWDEAGHYLFDETGWKAYKDEHLLPWQPWEIDCKLQPGCVKDWRGWHRETEVQGQAAIHHKDGWTALSFWDRTVDKRGGCNSTYIAEGTFTFPEMVEMAKTRFAYRWNKMNFPVVESTEAAKTQ